jgi:hypothetical protein
MPEIIADLEATVVSPHDAEYYVQIVGERMSNGVWEAWLEFVPLDDTLNVLITKTETTQSTREDVVRWSETLTATYVQGAFARALQPRGGRTLVRRYVTTAADVLVPLDPFELIALLGKAALRARLRVLSRPELLAMIRKYDLNPGRKSLTRLSDAQLVTFIVTAVEVQTVQGRH